MDQLTNVDRVPEDIARAVLDPSAYGEWHDLHQKLATLRREQTEPPWGGGEPSAAVVPSAISNAAFDAAGIRLRSVPFTPEKVKAALRRTP